MSLDEKCVFKDVRSGCDDCAGYNEACTLYNPSRARPEFKRFGMDNQAIMILGSKAYFRYSEREDYKFLMDR